MNFFKYIYDLFARKRMWAYSHFWWGGGTMLPTEIEDLHQYGITRIYSPDDGRHMGLQGMINDLYRNVILPLANYSMEKFQSLPACQKQPSRAWFLRLKTILRKTKPSLKQLLGTAAHAQVLVLGITGTGGSGKSSMVDEIVRRFIIDFTDKKLRQLYPWIHPKKTGGALLGDRIRMNAINNDRVYIRSLATRQSNLALSRYVKIRSTYSKPVGWPYHSGDLRYRSKWHRNHWPLQCSLVCDDSRIRQHHSWKNRHAGFCRRDCRQ